MTMTTKAKPKVTFIIPLSAKEQKSYRNFANTIRAKATRIDYDAYMKKFMKFHNIKSFDQLLQGDTLMIEERITQWLDEDKTITNSSKATYLAGIKHFYDMNRINLSWKIINKHLGEKERPFQDRAYKIEEILKMLNIANLREKMLLTLLTSAGLRRGAVASIKRKHIEKTTLGNYKIIIYAGTKDEYPTFCSRECSKYIDEYLTFRESKGERYTPEAPLLREEFDITDTLRASRPRHVTPHAVNNIIKSLTARADIRTVTHLIEGQEQFRSAMRKEVMLTHGLRKFCSTMMAKARVYPNTRERLTGHKTGLDKAYLKPEDEDLLAEYMKAEPLLTIDPTARQEVKIKELQSNEKLLLTTLEKQNADYEARLRNLEQSFLYRAGKDLHAVSTKYEKTDPKTGNVSMSFDDILKSHDELIDKAETDPEHFNDNDYDALNSEDP